MTCCSLRRTTSDWWNCAALSTAICTRSRPGSEWRSGGAATGFRSSACLSPSSAPKRCFSVYMRARSASPWILNACTLRCRNWTWTAKKTMRKRIRKKKKIKTRAARGAVRARGANQTEYLNNVRNFDLTFGIGPAGTGKTYLAVACAVEALQSEKVRRIVLVRPAVEAGERLGFLPGDLSQKVDPYLRPMYDALYEMMGFERVAKLIERNVIEVAPLAFMRGRSLNDSFVILDEAQNTTNEQMKMFLTRIGFGSKAVVTGDITQIDLPNSKQSGLRTVIDILRGVHGIAFTMFTSRDVVRHPLVQRIVQAYEASAPDNGA